MKVERAKDVAMAITMSRNWVRACAQLIAMHNSAYLEDQTLHYAASKATSGLPHNALHSSSRRKKLTGPGEIEWKSPVVFCFYPYTTFTFIGILDKATPAQQSLHLPFFSMGTWHFGHGLMLVLFCMNLSLASIHRALSRFSGLTWKAGPCAVAGADWRQGPLWYASLQLPQNTCYKRERERERERYYPQLQGFPNP